MTLARNVYGCPRMYDPTRSSASTRRAAGARQLAVLAAITLSVAACARSGSALPQLAGPLAWVVVEASFAGESIPEISPAPGLLLDSIAFPRLGEAAGTARFGLGELQRQLDRPIQAVDPMDVLECPPRQPCRVRGDGMYITLWDAQRTRTGIELVVSRTYNVQGLYRKTASVTHRVEVRGAGDAWRLTRRERLP
jgi:hypothetical protein